MGDFLRKRHGLKDIDAYLKNELHTIDVNEVQNKKKVLFSWDEIPDWQKDNEYIRNGYVRETRSVIKCLESLLYLHNESVNIYSHLIPALCFLFVIFFNDYAIETFETTQWVDYFVIDSFFLGAFTCLTMSSMYHCLKSHSLEIAILGNKLDYLGIVALISTSIVSILYYGFYDRKHMFYGFTALTLFFGLACSIVSVSSTFRSREWRPYRATLFVIFGLSALLPIIAGIFSFGLKETWERVQLKWIVLEAVLYISGAFFYGIRFPERTSPGSYDIWGYSHQIFHILVIIASCCHLKGLLGSYTLAHTLYFKAIS